MQNLLKSFICTDLNSYIKNCTPSLYVDSVVYLYKVCNQVYAFFVALKNKKRIVKLFIQFVNEKLFKKKTMSELVRKFFLHILNVLSNINKPSAKLVQTTYVKISSP
ncbi:hypothetical protein BpHYR1_017114 [Brachionus plicatilis]|uniref:Uncharacterized protein n=1 Tax=Brachionus plicatilis TaxID=10195 RepID=A0A3M7RIS9_BRAPC|nr:hypothetical protein BpHYR1_017114 [Brachionus plicatilis]